MTPIDFSLPRLGRQTVSRPEARLLAAAIESREFAVYGDGRSAARDHTRRLATRGLVHYLDAKAAGCASSMWGATLTCPGFNAVWEHHDNTHTPGCGSEWEPNGLCSGCGVARRLDLDAFDLFLTTSLATERDRSATRLWCNEHGYLRGTQWRTDKTCHQPGQSTQHEASTFRVGALDPMLGHLGRTYGEEAR